MKPSSSEENLSTLPIIELLGREYQWQMNGSIYGKGKLVYIARCNGQNHFVAFYTDNRTGEHTFGMSVDWATWERAESGEIIIKPRQAHGGEYIFSAPN